MEEIKSLGGFDKLMETLKKRLSEQEKKKLHDITFSWFHPLKNEWYPYLNSLRKGE